MTRRLSLKSGVRARKGPSSFESIKKGKKEAHSLMDAAMMVYKRTPPPVADLYPRKPADAMLITPGSKTSSNSNRLFLAWSSSRPSDKSIPSVYCGGGDSKLLPIAERSKTHAGIVVSPSGTPILKLESVYQGYFTPSGHHSGTPTGNAALRYNDYRNSSRVHSKDDERTGSFISLNGSGPSGFKTSGQENCGGNDFRSISAGQLYLREDKKVRFRSSAENGQSTNSVWGSPHSESENLFNDMSIGSNSSRSHSNMSSDWSERSRLHLWYEKRKESSLYGSHYAGRSCQMLCWLLMTTVVILILSLCLFFIFTDYQRSAVAPGDEVTLRQYLKRYLIGQDIAVEELSSLFDRFLYPSGATVPLVVSFHGGVGVGKSFTSQLISNYYFSDSKMSPCVSTFSVPLYHSLPSESTRTKLNEWLAVRDEGCPFQFHILDDLGSDTPCSLLSVIEELLREFHSEKSNYKHLVVVVTDVASVSIKQIVQEHLETNMEKELNNDHFTLPIKMSWAAIDKYQQQYTKPEDDPKVSCNFDDLSKFVNISIPFVPLQRHHVKQCAVNMSWRKGQQLSSDQVEWVADQVTYGSQSWPVFANSGCKSVSEKLNVVLNFGKV